MSFTKRLLMTFSCGLLLTAGLLLAAQDAGKADLEKLQGTWLTVSLVSNGKTVMDESTPPKPGPTTKLVYDGARWKVIVGDKTVAAGTFKLDATKTPKEIDILGESGTINDKTKLAIYVLEGDTYKYCIAAAGKPRPKELAAPEGSGSTLIVSRREIAPR